MYIENIAVRNFLSDGLSKSVFTIVLSALIGSVSIVSYVALENGRSAVEDRISSGASQNILTVQPGYGSSSGKDFSGVINDAESIDGVVEVIPDLTVGLEVIGDDYGKSSADIVWAAPSAVGIHPDVRWNKNKSCSDNCIVNPGEMVVPETLMIDGGDEHGDSTISVFRQRQYAPGSVEGVPEKLKIVGTYSNDDLEGKGIGSGVVYVNKGQLYEWAGDEQGQRPDEVIKSNISRLYVRVDDQDSLAAAHRELSHKGYRVDSYAGYMASLDGGVKSLSYVSRIAGIAFCIVVLWLAVQCALIVVRRRSTQLALSKIAGVGISRSVAVVVLECALVGVTFALCLGLFSIILSFFYSSFGFGIVDSGDITVGLMARSYVLVSLLTIVLVSGSGWLASLFSLRSSKVYAELR